MKIGRRDGKVIIQNFARFYRDALPLWEKGEGPRPMMIQDMPSILSKKRGVPDHRVVYYLLMDGMRWDLWERIKSDFFGKMPNLFRFAREGVLWANQPTDTSAQLALFEQAFRAVHGGLDNEGLFMKPLAMSTAKTPLRGHRSLGLDYAAVRELMPTARLKDRQKTWADPEPVSFFDCPANPFTISSVSLLLLYHHANYPIFSVSTKFNVIVFRV